MKKYVLNNKGFTLLETLIGLVVFSLIIIMMLNFLNVLKFNLTNNYETKQVVLFLSKVQEDILETKKVVEVSNDKLTLKNYLNENITYVKDKNRLIRKKNNQGYEIILNELENIKFEYINNILYVNLKFKNSENIYEEVINVK